MLLLLRPHVVAEVVATKQIVVLLIVLVEVVVDSRKNFPLLLISANSDPVFYWI